LTESHRPRPRLAIAGSIVTIALAATVAVVTSRAADWQPVGLVLILAAFYIPSEVLAVRSGQGGNAPWATTSSAPLVLAMTLTGPAPAALIGAVGLTIADTREHSDRLARITNQANFAAFIVTGALLSRGLSDAFGITPTDAAFAFLFISIYAFTNVGSFCINAISGRVAWGDSIRDQYRRERVWAGADAVAAPLAVATAYAYETIGLGALGLLVVVQLIYEYLARNLVISQDRQRELEERTEELKQLNAELADLSESRGRLVSQVLATEETERRRLAESLHEDALQDLVYAQGLAASQNGKGEQLSTAIGRAVERLREAIFDLHPAVLKHAGLAAALKEVAAQQADRGGFVADVQIDPEACGKNDQLLFALGREQLTNAAKHAKAGQVGLSIARLNGSVVMQIADDGCGMDAKCRRDALEQGHIGLASTVERVEALGGTVEIESEPGAGTLIRTVVPVKAEGFA
jgi:signal transduction histidine kinase